MQYLGLKLLSLLGQVELFSGSCDLNSTGAEFNGAVAACAKNFSRTRDVGAQCKNAHISAASVRLHYATFSMEIGLFKRNKLTIATHNKLTNEKRNKLTTAKHNKRAIIKHEKRTMVETISR